MATDTPMQLGMVGLGRMGANLVRRLMRDGHHCVGTDVGAETVFEYVEQDGVVHARYGGGAVRLGFLVGTRAGDTLRFRYAHVRPDGETATGRCESTIETLADGRLRLHETWAWESREGTGTSVVEEVL